ncbi:hypothetical protein N7G274_009074 [Stereocaulon virgatum]|uniref:Uncharacterized protein n=1 Tax=Stereocaulon virgatum TaxID=373712 RepID=A0ABR3ZWU3_9LECA
MTALGKNEKLEVFVHFVLRINWAASHLNVRDLLSALVGLGISTSKILYRTLTADRFGLPGIGGSTMSRPGLGEGYTYIHMCIPRCETDYDPRQRIVPFVKHACTHLLPVN